ncbi:uncharacterized protein TRIVIDRAFT_89933 [Trichoderma virens Gv29-8]|uniref:Thymidylate kinase n=1 Tax=Hypocrea virens (strain Gv29-8 / FGSC 10586) TaxID=413071 RepID=G9MZP1_HYPVG|nr:uncharacterized protein TRIVIDRAFT_89933 [Trichoderma virens Gv29-8]EHK20097.1 hypothetical protein TRIVIDRAFT_89933 [Trichoderma virens Gv29-8]UKZ45960.1 hypothetical protein TrVGV298_000156 [Trichoderma virens]
MAAVTRQPFAPLDGARLQSLTSLKNRQNANVSPKRKAEFLEIDNCENVDPLLFAKRSKGVSSGTPAKDSLKPTNFFLTPKISTPVASARSLAGQNKAASTPRRILNPKSNLGKTSVDTTPKSCPVAPAGRSPPQGKRSRLLSGRRRATRLDPPSFLGGSSAPFSLDAALKGTIAGYTPRPSVKKPVSSLLEPEAKASWFFDIHEDTPEQEMTNLLQHSTCTLDISSDEESEQRAKRDGAEGRDKENIPPSDDVSQTSAQRASPPPKGDEMIFEKQRVALGEMKASDFYAEGCDETSVILIHEDEEPEAPIASVSNIPEEPEEEEEEEELEIHEDIDALISRSDNTSSKAAVLQPIEGAGESFELWESSSAKDEAESVVGSP